MLSLFMLGGAGASASPSSSELLQRRDVRHLLTGKIGTGRVLLAPSSAKALLSLLLKHAPSNSKQQQQQPIGHELLLAVVSTWSSGDSIIRLPVKRQVTCYVP